MDHGILPTSSRFYRGASEPTVCREARSDHCLRPPFCTIDPVCMECGCFGIHQGDGPAQFPKAGIQGQRGRTQALDRCRGTSKVSSQETQVSEASESKSLARGDAQGELNNAAEWGAAPPTVPGSLYDRSANKDNIIQSPAIPRCLPGSHNSSCLPPRGGRSKPKHRSQLIGPGPHNRSPCDVKDAKTSSKSRCSGPLSLEAISQKTLSYPKWCAELVSNVLRTRTPFASFLAKTIRLTRTSRIAKSSTPTFFPVPLPTLGAFNRMPIDSSADFKHTRHLTQAVHVLVCALNYWYSGGRHGDMELLMRGPSKQHLLLYARIRSLIVSDGPAVVEHVPAAGRRFPELSARLGELSDFLTRVGCTANPYEKSYAGCPVAKNDAVDEKLQPYHDMDPTKILLFGNGRWDPVPFLEDNLCLAYLEPKVLLHGGKAPAGPLIRDAEETAAALAKKWDALGLLRLHKHPVHRDSPVRIFGALKSSEVHRQIGDHRGQNARECKVEGPSCDLPAGPDFGELFVDCNSETISLSITDRKDFYHQLKCSPSKAYMNTIGPPVDESLVSNTKAYSEFLVMESRKKYSRALPGDMLKEDLFQDLAYLAWEDMDRLLTQSCRVITLELKLPLRHVVTCWCPTASLVMSTGWKPAAPLDPQKEQKALS